jgi:uncharacterized protein (DUF58 family)
MIATFRDHLQAGEHAGSRYAIGAPRRIPLGAAGMQQGGRTGSSLEFKEHRDYQPGDDLRHIDWSAYARSDYLAVKLFHEEVNPHLDIVIDGSGSMNLDDSAKGAATLGLAALLATAAENSGYSRRVWVLKDGCKQLTGGGDRPAFWEEFDFNFAGNTGEALASRPPVWRPRGLRFILSDLLWLGDPLHVLSGCAERATSLVIVQVLARSDVNPPAMGNLRLVDAETRLIKDLRIDRGAIERYRSALARHQENWSRASRQVGAFFTTVVAEEIVRDWRLDELVAAEILRVV